MVRSFGTLREYNGGSIQRPCRHWNTISFGFLSSDFFYHGRQWHIYCHPVIPLRHRRSDRYSSIGRRYRILYFHKIRSRPIHCRSLPVWPWNQYHSRPSYIHEGNSMASDSDCGRNPNCLLLCRFVWYCHCRHEHAFYGRHNYCHRCLWTYH